MHYVFSVWCINAGKCYCAHTQPHRYYVIVGIDAHANGLSCKSRKKCAVELVTFIRFIAEPHTKSG